MIQIAGEHNHALEESYQNTTGMAQSIKDIIIKLLSDHPKLYPKQIRVYLNSNKESLGIQNYSFELHQIQSFVNRLRQKSNENDKILNVELFCRDHLYFQTIDPNKPFFLDLN